MVEATARYKTLEKLALSEKLDWIYRRTPQADIYQEYGLNEDSVAKSVIEDARQDYNIVDRVALGLTSFEKETRTVLGVHSWLEEVKQAVWSIRSDEHFIELRRLKLNEIIALEYSGPDNFVQRIGYLAMDVVSSPVATILLCSLPYVASQHLIDPNTTDAWAGGKFFGSLLFPVFSLYAVLEKVIRTRSAINESKRLDGYMESLGYEGMRQENI